MMIYLRSHVGSWEWILAILTVVLFVFSSVSNPEFLTAYNFQSAISNFSEKALMSLPMALLILTRQIDISVAAIAALCGIILAAALQAGLPLVAAVALSVVVGIACGLINGFFVTVLGMPALLVTLGSQLLFRGLCYVIVGGQPIAVPESIVNFGNNTIPGTSIPFVIIPFVVAAPIFALVVHKTPAGRRLFAIGGGPETARYSGVHDKRLTMILFVLSGVFASVAGIIADGRSSSATPDGLLGYELDCITVVFLGGFSFLGGSGKVSGLLWALILVVVLESILLLDGATGNGQSTAVGILLIGSLLVANIVRRLSLARRDKRNRVISLVVHSESTSTEA
jgi:rhamnose transport system permease protein